ncbi:hypothetical protein CWI38_0621p0030 [Hamiltosporidium tvaerminnensis]|uniref:Uncharacterized protein n=1 Tax=Hamiltosporidium tvaerminnensis TaxID=1176355 RepID=A0A4Q9LYH1_9MICR|nr:hypothetical protein CWI38_0621p0030 [Hamiltosporidium tvaerminnensis]
MGMTSAEESMDSIVAEDNMGRISAGESMDSVVVEDSMGMISVEESMDSVNFMEAVIYAEHGTANIMEIIQKFTLFFERCDALDKL